MSDAPSGSAAAFTLCQPDEAWTLLLWAGQDPYRHPIGGDNPEWTISFENLAGFEFCGVEFEYTASFSGTTESEWTTGYVGFTNEVRPLNGLRIRSFGALRNELGFGVGTQVWNGANDEYMDCPDGTWCSFGPDKYINGLRIVGYPLNR